MRENELSAWERSPREAIRRDRDRNPIVEVSEGPDGWYYWCVFAPNPERDGRSGRSESMSEAMCDSNHAAVDMGWVLA